MSKRFVFPSRCRSALFTLLAFGRAPSRIKDFLVKSANMVRLDVHQFEQVESRDFGRAALRISLTFCRRQNDGTAATQTAGQHTCVYLLTSRTHSRQSPYRLRRQQLNLFATPDLNY